jgi:hypothetical protein
VIAAGEAWFLIMLLLNLTLLAWVKLRWPTSKVGSMINTIL